MYRKFIFIFLSVFSFTYAVDEIDIEKRREEQQSFDNLIKTQNFNMSENNKDKEENNLILNINSIDLYGNTILESFQINAILRKYIGKNKNVYTLINEIENKYIENGYITTKVGLDISKSDFEIGKISIFVLEGKIAKVIYGRGAILNNSRDLTQSQLEKLSEIGSKYIKDPIFQNIYKFKRRKTN